MSGTIFRISVAFLVGVLAFLALALCASDYYAQERQRLLAAGDARGAAEASRMALRLDPFDTDALEAQALTLQQQEKYEEAAAVLREAIERDPNNYFPYLLLGSVQLAMDDPDAAVESYRDVLELNPKATSASIYMAQTLLSQGKQQEAKEEYLKLEREGRISDDALYNLGRIEVRTGEAEEGLRDIKAARRQERSDLEDLEGPTRKRQEELLRGMDLAVADAMVVAGRESRAREILSNSPSEQAPSLLRLLDSDPDAYREQVVNSDVY
jgi:tetratricopeptide (TPR) repeat protein